MNPTSFRSERPGPPPQVALPLTESERAAAIGGDSALVAGVALIEEHAADALRKRKTA